MALKQSHCLAQETAVRCEQHREYDEENYFELTSRSKQEEIN